jgi:hypothetical protein
MRNNTATDNKGTVAEKQISLEELDVLCRQCHHLHDEEVFSVVSGFLSKLATLFMHEKNQHIHSSAR